MSKKTLDNQVRYCLDKYPETRNSDITLTMHIWKEFYQEKLTVVDGVLAIRLRDLFDLPREDNVKRVRAHIQNDLHEYIPTNWEVAKKRKWLQYDWRLYLGYTQEAVVKAKTEEQNNLFNLVDTRR